MLLVAGLGNPGSRHAGNRHNIGYMAADAIARRHSFSNWSKKFRGEIAEGHMAGEKVLLIKPQTYMNLSGESIGEAMRFYKLAPSDLIVIYDELDLAPGKVRIKTGGGHGGHNGIRSIDSHCGKDYRRLRLGIGHPGHKERVNSHVLGDFAKADREWVETLLEAVADNFPMLIEGDDSGFLNKIAVALGNSAPGNGKKNADPQKGQSHIRAARPKTAPEPPKSGPMADMLKKLFGNKD
ncbi:aminoacyl-tRNA hydrolase [Hoeflea poritis]|uniref:Peptidyl-tRNA hydrolase n=1 Tax=Hoeflea poritis TaxID=2993659 RepID=A0ABT4VTD2_9HYPH|nr:aminoacyl-tRNA hydrolase [Hoeflea poritis]MDA4847327.1 aminoacyl-tRNA hydrolase [Hoeflea poritis]